MKYIRPPKQDTPSLMNYSFVVTGKKEDVDKAAVKIEADLKKYTAVTITTPFIAQERFKQFLDALRKLE